ncbi:MAG: hypothetical protein KGQ58_04675 [Proteobacteria bacterium]|nr:hypothetical protein [Pseudomonadota bacterium]MDE3207540.1 hypothetical protein [Pseudomonadota bacterium]
MNGLGITGQVQKSGMLLTALEGASQWRPLFCFIVAVLIGASLFTFVSFFGNEWLTLLAGLFALIISLAGLSASGFMMMDRALGNPQRSVRDAIEASLQSLHRFVGCFMVWALSLFVSVLLVSVFLVFCRIPYIGPLLFAAVYPLSAVLIGLVNIAMAYLFIAILSPAIWEGRTILGAIARLWVVLENKALVVLVQLLLLGVLVALVGFITYSVTNSGSSVVLPMANGIIGSKLGNGGVTLGAMFDALQDGATAYQYAVLFSSGVIFLVALSMPVMVAVLGACLIYQNVTDGLEFDRVETVIEEHFKLRRQRRKKNKSTIEPNLSPDAEQPPPHTD